MDYEKLHKETLERLQQIVREGKMTEEVAKYICPDLVAESEDERIRKAIVEHFEAFTPIKLFGERGTVTRDQVLAYLEKQKEQAADEKYAGMVVVSQEEWDAAIAEAFKIGRDEGERQRKQKPAEWSEEDEGELQVAAHRLASHGYPEDAAWLKDLPERFNLQPKQGWSDSDKAFLKVAIAICNRYSHKDIADWLKDLRSRPKSSDNWKPSEYTLSLVKKVANGEMLTGMEQMAMEALCDDLQKLLQP